MKRLIALFLAATTLVAVHGQTASDSAWRTDVKTVQLYPGSTGHNPMNANPIPIIPMEGRERLVLEFDVLGAEAESLKWHIAHCDRHWHRDELEPQDFISGFEEGAVEEYDYSFTTLTDYVHYRCTIPDRHAAFTHSGNYVLTVFADGDGQVLLTRRFCVSEQSVGIMARCTKPYDGIAADQRQEVDVKIASDAQTLQYTAVAVQQNGRTDNMRWLEFTGYEGGTLTFCNRRCNIFDGGNTFRYFDCSNLRAPMYNVVKTDTYGGELLAFIKPEEDRSGRHYVSETTLNGGMKINIQDRNNPRLEADYVWVNLSLPMAQPMMDGDVYVVGALTDWKLDSTALMDYNPAMRAYTKRLLLKQGYYAYQLLVRRPGSAGSGSTARLEGDHYETSNRYTAYVYQHLPSDRADRLVAVGSCAR